MILLYATLYILLMVLGILLFPRYMNVLTHVCDYIIREYKTKEWITLILVAYFMGIVPMYYIAKFLAFLIVYL